MKIILHNIFPICLNIEGNSMNWIALSLCSFNFWFDKFDLFFHIFRYIKVSYVAIARNSSKKSVTWKPISNQYTESQNGNFIWLLFIWKKRKWVLNFCVFLYYFRYYHNAKQFANVSGQKYNFVCSICSETISLKNINSHGCKLTAKKHFECPFCAREFQMQAQLDIHLSNGWCKEMQKTKSVEESRKVYKVRFECILGVIFINVSPLWFIIGSFVHYES